ncbi:hypothetical protein [Paraglaciecola sp. L1A13]|uniref:hypothetical protein n=1 Tax=Paraglaciecola sp. L1A13 TaxID=2686359 RepID=UPI001E5143F6|nr:hypothetical protein [Paraglaciecola sp. L1A13]
MQKYCLSVIDYCELVECTDVCTRDDKAGHIVHVRNPILERLNINSEQWLTLSTEFE